MAGEDETENSSPNTTTIMHVAPKLPKFWPEDPELFFVRVEAEFAKSHPKISTEQTKFSYLVSSLAKEHAMLVRNFLLHPDALIPYSALKDELIRQFSLPDHARLQHAQAESLEDRKPSALLCRLQQLLPTNKFSDTFVRDLFLSKMPANIQTVLAAMVEKELQSLAATADAIVDFKASPAPATMQAAEINALREEVSALRTQLQRQGQQNRGYTTSNDSGNGLCWYHNKFGRKAQKCVRPCRWGN